MTTLPYDISIIGLGAVNRALGSLERRLSAFNRKQAAMFGGAGSAAGRTAAGRSATTRMLGPDRRAFDRQQQLNYRREMAAQRKVAAEEAKAHRDRMRYIKREQAARDRAAAKQRRQQVATRRSLVKGGLAATGRGVRNAVRGVGALAGSALALGGGMAMSAAFEREKAANGRATALANQARGTSAAGGKSIAELRKQILGTAQNQALVSGISKEQIIGGMRAFHGKAGDINAATQLAPYFTELADATDASLEDIGRSAGIVFGGLRNKGLDAATAMKQTVKIMDAMAGQAKIGSIEMDDLARNMGALISASADYQGDVADLTNTLGAMAQIAVLGKAKSPEEAMTALLRFSDDLTKMGRGGRNKFEAQGIQVYADKSKTKLRDPLDIVVDMLGKTKGSLPKVKQLFGVRSEKAVSALRGLYIEKGGGQKGLEAVRQRIEEFKGQALTTQQRKEAAAARRADIDKKMDMLMEKFASKVGPKMVDVMEKLLPSLEKLIPHFETLATKIGEWIDYFSKNPVEGLGIIVGAAIAKEIALAGIAGLIKSAINAAIPLPTVAPTPGVPVVAPAPGGLGVLGKLGVGAAAVIETAGGFFSGRQRAATAGGGKTAQALGGGLGAYTGALTGGGLFDALGFVGEAAYRNIVNKDSTGFFDELATVTDPNWMTPGRGLKKGGAGGVGGAAGLGEAAVAAMLQKMANDKDNGSRDTKKAAADLSGAAQNLSVAAFALSAGSTNLNRGDGPNPPPGPTGPR